MRLNVTICGSGALAVVAACRFMGGDISSMRGGGVRSMPATGCDERGWPVSSDAESGHAEASGVDENGGKSWHDDCLPLTDPTWVATQTDAHRSHRKVRGIANGATE